MKERKLNHQQTSERRHVSFYTLDRQKLPEVYKQYKFREEQGYRLQRGRARRQPLLVLNGRPQEPMLLPKFDTKNEISSELTPKELDQKSVGLVRWAVTGAFPAAPLGTRTSWTRKQAIINSCQLPSLPTGFITGRTYGFGCLGQSRLEVSPVSSQSDESSINTNQSVKDVSNTSQSSNTSQTFQVTEISTIRAICEKEKITSNRTTSPESVRLLNNERPADAMKASPTRYSDVNNKTQDKKLCRANTGKRSSPTLTTQTKSHSVGRTMNVSEKQHTKVEEKCELLPIRFTTSSAKKPTKKPARKKSTKSLQIYTNSDDVKTVKIKVHHFESEPCLDPLSVVFHYPATAPSLNHCQVYSECMKSLTSTESNILSVRYIPLNVILAANGLHDRWVIGLDTTEGVHHLIKQGLTINGRHVCVEPYDKVVREDYERFQLVQRVHHKTATHNLKTSKLNIEVV